MSKCPERKHEVAIRIGADDWDGVIGALRDILFKFHEGPGQFSISGGASFSYIAIDKTNPDQTHDNYFEEVKSFSNIVIETNPDQTHDNYFEEVNAWLDLQRKRKKNDKSNLHMGYER